MHKIDNTYIKWMLPYMFAIVAAISVYSYLYLVRSHVIESIGKPCVYDVILYTNFKAFPYIILIIILFFMVTVFNEEFNVMRVVRQVSVRTVWAKCCMKLAGYSLIFAIYTTIVTVLLGILLTREIFNWNQIDSYAFGKINDFAVSIPLLYLIFVFFLSIFSGVFCMGLIILLFWWFTKTPVWGFVITVAISFAEGMMHVSGIFLEKYIMVPSIYFNGINIFNQVIYPICLDIIMIIVFTLCIRRRDFLDNIYSGSKYE